MEMGIDDWRPSKFASIFRGQALGPPPIGRWEELLRAERTPAIQLADHIARCAPLRRLFGLPAHLASSGGTSLADREARVRAIRGTKMGQVIERLLGPHEHQFRPVSEHTAGKLPTVGALLDREINAALALLASMAFEELQRRGWHFQPNHFYWPLNDIAFLRENPQLWSDPKLPSGIDWDLDGQADLIQRLARYSDELADVRAGSRERPGELVWGQGFGGLDVYAYYGLLRDLQPTRVVEVGIGTSSNVLARALAMNEHACAVTLIDPTPKWDVLGQLPEHWQVLPSLVQHVDPEVFARLQAGDILFYDGSHCVRTGSDVNWIFFEVLPALPPGVWIHVHDIAWPGDYGRQWTLDEGLSWNEQYLVQAFLMHNTSYRVRLGSVLLHHYKLPLLLDLFPRENIGGASSVWLQKVV